MRSPTAINLVLLAGGVSLFGGAAIISNRRQHELDCQEMRNKAIPDIHHQCSPDPAQARNAGGGYTYHHYYSSRGSWFDYPWFGQSRGYYGDGYSKGWSSASYDAGPRTPVTRGGFGLFGGRFSLRSFGG